METSPNFTPLDEDMIEKEISSVAPEGDGFFQNRKMLFFTIGAFAVISILVIVITLLIRMKDSEVQAKGASMENIEKVSAGLDGDGSLDVLGKPTASPKVSLTRPPTRTQTPTKTPTLTPKVTPTSAPTATFTPTLTQQPTLLPTATMTPPATNTPTHTLTPTNTPTITPTPTVAPPGVPTGLVGTAGTAEMVLAWTAPSSTGGAAITDYVVEYKLTSEPTVWSVFNDGPASATTGATVTGLTSSTSYDFKVAAVNSAGQGSYSSMATATPN